MPPFVGVDEGLYINGCTPNHTRTVILSNMGVRSFMENPKHPVDEFLIVELLGEDS